MPRKLTHQVIIMHKHVITALWLMSKSKLKSHSNGRKCYLMACHYLSICILWLSTNDTWCECLRWPVTVSPDPTLMFTGWGSVGNWEHDEIAAAYSPRATAVRPAQSGPPHSATSNYNSNSHVPEKLTSHEQSFCNFDSLVWDPAMNNECMNMWFTYLRGG